MTDRLRASGEPLVEGRLHEWRDRPEIE